MSVERKVGQRILIRGTSGSGKSTLGAELGRRLNIPHTEIDSVYHLPNWQTCPTEEFRAKIAAIAAGEAWVLDGNYRATVDILLPRVDTLIFLDYPLPLIMRRLVARTLRRSFRREELWNGNREVLWKHLFTRESLILWALQTYKKRSREAGEFLTNPAYNHLIIRRFKHPSELDAWLREL